MNLENLVSILKSPLRRNKKLWAAQHGHFLSCALPALNNATELPQMSERAAVNFSENLNIEGSWIPFCGNSNSSLISFLRGRNMRASGHANVAKAQAFEATQQFSDAERPVCPSCPGNSDLRQLYASDFWPEGQREGSANRRRSGPQTSGNIKDEGVFLHSVGPWWSKARPI
ncbi:MAG TPA: hypothetical protein VIX19_14300 [Terriglobales bacterium]